MEPNEVPSDNKGIRDCEMLELLSPRTAEVVGENKPMQVYTGHKIGALLDDFFDGYPWACVCSEAKILRGLSKKEDIHSLLMQPENGYKAFEFSLPTRTKKRKPGRPPKRKAIDLEEDNFALQKGLVIKKSSRIRRYEKDDRIDEIVESFVIYFRDLTGMWRDNNELKLVDEEVIKQWMYYLTEEAKATISFRTKEKKEEYCTMYLRSIREVLRVLKSGWLPIEREPFSTQRVLVRGGAGPPYIAVVQNEEAAFLKSKRRKKDENKWYKRVEVSFISKKKEHVTWSKMVPKNFIADCNAENLERIQIEKGNPLAKELSEALNILLKRVPSLREKLGSDFTFIIDDETEGIPTDIPTPPKVGQEPGTEDELLELEEGARIEDIE